ncbi:MAG: DUF3995 domain-containing protein [Nannocystaceae bacterium]|nr:DUF3995 domain-containing protein [bacterium]
MLAYVAVGILTLIAALHSILGEGALLRPLFAKEWDIGIPRFAAERIFRFAWHLTSVAWVGLAVAVAGVPLLHAAAMVCIVSGTAIFVMLRGHLAWPLFLAAGVCLLVSGDAIPATLLTGVASVGGGLAASLAGLHAYWAVGGRWGIANAVPQREDGTPAFRPGPLACLAVSTACAVLGALLVWPVLAPVPLLVRVGLWAALVVFILRAVGDGRQVGFSKSDRETAFAQADDALYSPLVVGLAFACGAALLLA